MKMVHKILCYETPLPCRCKSGINQKNISAQQERRSNGELFYRLFCNSSELNFSVPDLHEALKIGRWYSLSTIMHSFRLSRLEAVKEGGFVVKFIIYINII